MFLGLANIIPAQNKSITSGAPPVADFFIELEDGSGFIALETSLSDLILQEAAP